MRLIRHLNEASELEENLLLELIHKECKPWLKEIGNFNITVVKNPVFRGVEQSIRLFRVLKGTRRTDREPKLTQKEVFEIFDKAFADRFGWWVRSKGVFTGSEHVSDTYGTSYVFFPMGKYRYVWSNEYNKIWHNLTHPDTWEMMTDTGRKKHLISQKIDAAADVKFYNNKNIKAAMRKNRSFEAIFECKQYLLMERSTYIGISDRIGI